MGSPLSLFKKTSTTFNSLSFYKKITSFLLLYGEYLAIQKCHIIISWIKSSKAEHNNALSQQAFSEQSHWS